MRLATDDDWLTRTVEEPVRDLVKLLRDNGFNTYYSCGHPPRPCVHMEWYEDGDVTDLYDLLVDYGYDGFRIAARWDAHELSIQRCRWIVLTFLSEDLLLRGDV